MPRRYLLLLLASGLFAAGCRTFDDRNALFPRLRDRRDGDDDRYADRFRDRYTLPTATASNPCLPCGGTGGYPNGGLMSGTPGGYGYGTPTGFSSGPTLGTPVFPGGDGIPVRPRRDDELPQPGEYSRPGAVEMGRSAPKPPGVVPVAGK